jgi:Gram-negative bacterial tonB protein.
MRRIAALFTLVVLGCLFTPPPALSSFPVRPGAVWSQDCCGKPIVREEPKFPPGSSQSGWVIVSGILDGRGWVTEPKVLASDPAGVFDQAAVTAFDAWRYKLPAGASAGPYEVRELLRFERRRAPSSMPSDSGGGGGGGGSGY